MKKVIIALVIAMIIPCCIFAGRGMFDLTIGAAAQTSYDIEDVQNGDYGENHADDVNETCHINMN